MNGISVNVFRCGECGYLTNVLAEIHEHRVRCPNRKPLTREQARAAFNNLKVEDLERLDAVSDYNGFTDDDIDLIEEAIGWPPCSEDFEAVRLVAVDEYLRAIGRA